MKYEYTKEKRDPQIQWYKTESGKRWRVKFSVVKKTKRYHLQKNGFKSFADAQLAKAQMLTELDNNTFTVSKNTTVQAYWDTFNVKKVESGDWRRTTFETQTRHFNTHILPRFGQYKLSDVTREEIQDWINRIAKTDRYSKKTMRSVVTSFKTMLQQAVLDGDLLINPAMRIKVTGRPPRDQSMSRQEYEAIHTYIYHNNELSPRDRAVLVLAMHGLRRGEIAGMKLKYVTPTAVTVAGQRTVFQEYTDPKSESSVRVVPLMPGAYDILLQAISDTRSRLAQQDSRIMNEEDSIFVGVRNCVPMNANNVTLCFSRMSDALGFHVWPHKMRHAFSTFAFNTPGINPKDIMNILGHSSLDMSMHYNTGTDEGKNQVVNTMFDTFN